MILLDCHVSSLDSVDRRRYDENHRRQVSQPIGSADGSRRRYTLPMMVRSPRATVVRATGTGLFVASLVLAAIYFGSRRLRDFDAALVPYAGASVFSAFGLGYRYSMWLTKPPTRLYWRRGWRLFFAPARILRNLSHLASLFAMNFVAQRFIEKRSPLRWAAHWCLAWKRGVSLVEGALGEAVGKLYVERHFPAAAKERMVTLVANLVEAYRQSISTLDWMGPATRERALAKLAKFTPKIGYPDEWKDYSALRRARRRPARQRPAGGRAGRPTRSWPRSASRSTGTSG